MFQLIGQGAFIAASFALGFKLLRLYGRTRETAELTIGLAFLVGGALGYVSWIALAIARLSGAADEIASTVAIIGLVFTCFGGVCNGIGNRAIYRPDAVWPQAFVGVLALTMLVGIVLSVGSDGGGPEFWIGLLACAPIYTWGAIESFILARALDKRARIGLADPLVALRVKSFGAASVAVVVTIGIAFGSRLLHGPLMPESWAVANAATAMLAAIAIWAGFFPPAWLRTRVAAKADA